MSLPSIDRGWTLFLDRDGVLNRQRIDDYVKSVAEFEWLPGAIEAVGLLRPLFGRLFIVTNQQGVGKGLMSQAHLDEVHRHLKEHLAPRVSAIDAIYTCTALDGDQHPWRKPAPGMALQAKAEFPEIDFARSIMVGDSPSDMGFGESLGMFTVGIGPRVQGLAKAEYSGLLEFAQALSKQQRIADPTS